MATQAASRLTELLIQAQSADLTARTTAEQSLRAAEEQDLANFLRELSVELRNTNSADIARQLSGLLLKNAISGTDPKIDKAKRMKWASVPPEAAADIKQNAFETLSTECDEARSAACQVIAKIARVEIPMKAWPQLIPDLLKLVMSENVAQRKGALTAYGYICEDIQQIADEMPGDVDVVTLDDCNTILTGVVTGMKDANNVIKLIATRALYHAVFFAYRNIQNEEERAYLLSAVGNNLRDPDYLVKQAAWECVIQIASEFYEYMGPYITEFATMSLEAIKEGNEMTALPAIEFWNNICDEEIAILQGQSDRNMLDLMAKAKEVLLPVLFEVMTKQSSEETEQGDWTLSMAAGTCVGLCAEVLRDDILDLTLQFVNANFAHQDWQCREAAVYAYGSIMEGPTSDKLQPLVQESFVILCQRLDDASVAVRDTTAWTVGRIAKFHFSCIGHLLGTPDQVGLINMLLSKLQDQPRVAAQICFAIHEIANNCGGTGDQPLINAPNGVPQSTQCDVWLRSIVEALYQAAVRDDADECKLRTSAYTTIGEVISCLQGPEKPVIVAQLYQNLLTLLETSINDPLTDQVTQLQMELCGCMERCIRVSDVESIKVFADRSFIALTRVLYGNGTAATPESLAIPFSVAAEDALMAINALAVALGERFEPYAPRFCQSLHEGIENHEDEAFCEKCIDMTGDLARCLGKKFTGVHCDEVMMDLCMTLKDTKAKVALKPKAMQAIGDVAFNVGGEFVVGLKWPMEILRTATQTRVEQGPVENEEWIEFIRRLRDSVVWAYQGIFLGISPENKQHTLGALNPHLQPILEFINLIVEDPMSSAMNHVKAVELLCDLVAAFPDLGPKIKEIQFYKKVHDLATKSGEEGIRLQVQQLDKLVGQVGSYT